MTVGSRRALRVAGSALLLAAVIWTLPAGSLQAALANASPSVLALATACFLVSHLIAAFKWRMLMGPSAAISFPMAARAHFTGLVANLTPLGMIGGDVVRAGVAINSSGAPGAIMLTGVVDRIVDSIALVVLAVTGFVWIGGGSMTAWIVFWGGIAVSAAGVGVLIAGYWLVQRSRQARLAGIREAFQVLRQRPGLVGRALALSVLVQGALISANAYIGASVGVDCSFGAWLLAWPAAKFAAYLPIGVAGIGIREAALVALLRPFGGAPGAVMAAGLLWEALIILGALIGWLVLCVLPSRRQQAARPIQIP
jgi:uncharacterized membrane protein YbhN (UPF0104 family)